MSPILVTGAAGSVGSVGRHIVEGLLKDKQKVRAFVRADDERAEELRKIGAEVFVGDLTRASDVANAIKGCTKVYFGMSVSDTYLEATTILAAVAKQLPDIEVLVNMSQMTVSEIGLDKFTDSKQQQYHWLSEQILNWSGLPVVHVRPTMFLQHPFIIPFTAMTIKKEHAIKLPFNNAKISPIDTRDIAEVVVKILQNPKEHVGKVYQLTGPESIDLNNFAQQCSSALGFEVKYIDQPLELWISEILPKFNLSIHAYNHVSTMARLVAQNRYDRFTNDVEKILGRKATSVYEFVKDNIKAFQP
eukprot:TRINITY_DN1723_c0_g2_i1.p1 TRINITY_DN1723_c0_g2~~TRINITY_DN1723_c0_g2_i1.p1  ORF type:complete len:303 (+),score=54.96 TRINITY_DN1723_c0_g2_i1:274-1182(+)